VEARGLDEKLNLLVDRRYSFVLPQPLEQFVTALSENKNEQSLIGLVRGTIARLIHSTDFHTNVLSFIEIVRNKGPQSPLSRSMEELKESIRP
jgi:hypothetical protein